MKTILWIIVAIAILNCLSEGLNIGATVAQAQEKPEPQIIERWECYDDPQYRHWALSQQYRSQRTIARYELLQKYGGPRDQKPSVLVSLKRQRFGNFETGEIVVSGSTKPTAFQIQGINRRWDFGKNGKYAFIIYPNKTGLYYDFRGSEGKTVKPRQFFFCEQR